MARKKRVMTEEQRKAAADRLAAARAKKGHDGSASVNINIRDMDVDHPLHWKKVKVWIKELTEEIKSKKNLRDSKDAKQRSEYNILVTYVANLKRYIESGVYLDARYGRHREGRMQQRAVHMAYDENGYPKRTVGHWYPDIGDVWTHEMKAEFNNVGKRTRKQLHDQEEVHEVGGDDSI